MFFFLLRRLAQSVAVLWFMSVIVFAGIYVVGDPASMMIPDNVTPEMRDQMMAALGLDKPAVTRSTWTLPGACWTAAWAGRSPPACR
jgi:ABC-type dipeptide/oligopeptide/nickel transport system permease component